MRTLAAALGLIALAASFDHVAAQAVLQCSGAMKRAGVAELLFGRKIGNRAVVSDVEWGRFLDDEITPRFPNGLSVVDAQGRWRDRKRNITVHEPSKLVTIVLPGEPSDQARLAEIITAYKARFGQQSVGLIVRPACVSF